MSTPPVCPSPRNLLPVLFSLFCLGLCLVEPDPAMGQPAAPDDIRTWGLKNDRVKISWRDNSNDENEFRIERADNGGGFSQIGTAAANTGSYEDNGVNLAANSYLYRVRAFRSSDTSFSGYTATAAGPLYVSGANFRVFYNTSNAPPYANGNVHLTPSGNNGMGMNDYAARQLTAMEGSLKEFMTNFGFNAPYNPMSPDLLPVNLKYCDGGGCAGGCGVGLAPAFLATYNHTTNVGDPASLLIAAHELFHMIQFSYDAIKTDPAGAWVVEGQARAIQDLVCIDTPSDSCMNVDDDPGGIANFYGEANGFLGNPNRPINEASYGAALFWIYMCDHYGTTNSEPNKGLDFLQEFWEEADDDVNRDGIQVIDATLMNLGSPDRFKQAFQKFAVANYAKALPGASVPFKYKYTDESQVPGPYDDVRLDVDLTLAPGEQVGPLLSDVSKWGARYHEFRPDPMEPYIQVDYSVDFTDPAYFHFLAIKGGEIVVEDSAEGLSFMKSIANDDYDAIVMIVVGLNKDVNFRYSFNSVQPVVRILDPKTSRKAKVGDKDAPEKFLAKLEVLSPGGDPIEGIAENEFSFEVGPQSLSAGNIVTSAYVQGQYWFVIQAPTQTVNTTYDLVANWSILSDTQTDAIDYTPQADADNVLVIDRSGSMNTPVSKIEDAKDAAKLYVDSWRDGDGVGVVSFNCESTPIDLTLREWNDTSRDAAHMAITNISAGGGTSIGDGLNQGLDELVMRGDTMHTWALILLSDGNNTCDADIQDFLDGVYKTRDEDGDPVPAVHCVAIGPDANRPDLESLASQTGGAYHFASEPSSKGPGTDPFVFDIAEIYRNVSSEVARKGQVLAVRGTTRRDRDDVHEFNVDAGASELVAAARWESGSPGILLRSPSGVVHTVPFKEISDTHKVFRIGAPEPGKWKFEIGVQPPCQECISNYLLEASIKSSLTMDLYLGLTVEERKQGIPLPILVSLTTTGPVTGADVEAEVTNPSGGVTLVKLHDDGAHGDGGPDDGIYGNNYYGVSQEGSYKVCATAEGNSDLGPFNRRLCRAFFIREDEDNDQDRMPDGYEKLVGLDPTKPDAGGDPDKDKLNNFQECTIGTDPFDPDTDDGGEQDGSEFFGQRNPLEPGDDRVRPPRLVAVPRFDHVLIRINLPRIFDITPTIVYANIYRATEEGEFFPHLFDIPLEPPFEFLDQQIVPGQPYRYYAEVHYGDGSPVSAPSDETDPAMSKEDPYPPHGAVVINDGSPTVTELDVQLHLIAMDEYDPEYDFPDRDELDPRTLVSGVFDMMVSNKADLSDATWEPYQTPIPWILEPNDMGIATVFAKFRDGMDNESLVYHASAMLAEGGCNVPFGDFDLNSDGAIGAEDMLRLMEIIRKNQVGPDLDCKDGTDSGDLFEMSRRWKSTVEGK